MTLLPLLRLRFLTLPCVLALLLGTACAADRLAFGVGPNGSGSRDSGVEPLPDTGIPRGMPELITPGIGRTHAFIANPLHDNVSIIDLRTLSVVVTPVGDRPDPVTTAQLTSGADEVALTRNAGTGDFALIRLRDGRATVTRIVPETPVTSRPLIKIRADGAFAVVWNPALQEFHLLDLRAGQERATRHTVGIGPVDATFDVAGNALYVESARGVAKLSLEGTIASGALTARDFDVDTGTSAIVPGALYAIGSEGVFVRLVDLSTGSVVSLTMGEAVSDVDVLPDGSAALVVQARAGKVVRVPIPAGFTDASLLTERSFGVALDRGGEAMVLSSDGSRGAIGIATTAPATPAVDAGIVPDAGLPADAGSGDAGVTNDASVAPTQNEGIVVFDTNLGAHTTYEIDQRAAWMVFTGNGLQLLVAHSSSGYSVVDTTSAFVRFQITDAALEQRFLAQSGSRVFAFESNRARLHDVDLATHLITTTPFPLSPVQVAVSGSGESVVITQSSVLSIYLLAERSIRNASGFELNGAVRETP